MLFISKISSLQNIVFQCKYSFFEKLKKVKNLHCFVVGLFYLTLIKKNYTIIVGGNMEKNKKLFFLQFVFILLIPLILMSACGYDNNGDNKHCNVSISDQLPQGISSACVIDGQNVSKGEDVEFVITFSNLYEIGDLKVLGNGVELVNYEKRNTDNGIEYYYRIANITEDVIITFSGSLKFAEYNVTGNWVDNLESSKTDDKDIKDFFVDMEIESVNGNASMGSKSNFESVAKFKEYIKSNKFNRTVFCNDIITFCVYSKDNCESFVDEWIMCDGVAIIPETQVKTEIIQETEVRYLMARYTIYITGNTNIYFYEKAIVRSVEIPVSKCVVDGIKTNENFSPKIVLKDESGLEIKDYITLKEKETVDAYIENISDVWRPLFNNPSLEYSLSYYEQKFEFKAGEYVSNKGDYVFKSVGKPYDRGTFANFTLYITNAKELIMSDSNYKKITIETNNVIGYSMFENEYISIDDDGKYCYTECSNHMNVRIKNNYTKIKIEFSNDWGDEKIVTLDLPINGKEQDVTGGYTISRYRLEDTYKIYTIYYKGTEIFYNHINITALEN